MSAAYFLGEIKEERMRQQYFIASQDGAECLDHDVVLVAIRHDVPLLQERMELRSVRCTVSATCTLEGRKTLT